MHVSRFLPYRTAWSVLPPRILFCSFFTLLLLLEAGRNFPNRGIIDQRFLALIREYLKLHCVYTVSSAKTS